VTVKRTLLRGVNAALGRLGFRLSRSGYLAFEDYRGFIPFAQTLGEAQAAGLSVTDYVDSHYNVAGATQDTVDRLAALGALHAGVKRVCELGPGSGRYLEKVQKACRPEAYEVYETALDWRDYVVRTFGVVGHDADGVSMKQTPDRSCDLVQAHKVFPGVPFLSTCRYLLEMARVVRTGGHVVFDVVTEDCMEPATLSSWLGGSADYQVYPNLLPKQYVRELMGGRGLELVGSFPVPMKPGATECFVFVKR
jgi:hypothetical protein